MPSVTRIGAYRFFFYNNEGTEPPHIHVQHEQSLAKFWLDPLALAASTGFASHELRRIEGIIAKNQVSFLESWREFFDR